MTQKPHKLFASHNHATMHLIWFNGLFSYALFSSILFVNAINKLFMFSLYNFFVVNVNFSNYFNVENVNNNDNFASA